MKRDKEAREEAGITFSYIQSTDQNYDGDSDMDELDFLDENYDLEEMIMQKILGSSGVIVDENHPQPQYLCWLSSFRFPIR